MGSNNSAKLDDPVATALGSDTDSETPGKFISTLCVNQLELRAFRKKGTLFARDPKRIKTALRRRSRRTARALSLC